MKFNIDDYKGKYAMHCKTEEEAKSFCDYLCRVDRTWQDGQTYKSTTCYAMHREKTAYNFNSGTYSDMEYYKSNNYTILEWEDFMKRTFTKADLKNWDIIQYRNGKIAIVSIDLNSLISETGYNSLNEYMEDLTVYDHDFDIIAVRRPKIAAHCQLDAFKYSRGTLVYERKEVEEMTLEQVCKLLGKEIKIIK